VRRHPNSLRASIGEPAHTAKQNRKPLLELLESRHLMTTVAGTYFPSDMANLTSHDSLSDYSLAADLRPDPLPDALPVVQAPTADLAASSPLFSLPQRQSDPGATDKLFLDFDGNHDPFLNVDTPAYDTDGNPTSFSDAEVAAINQIWATVAEDYAPFNVDVTTIDPGYDPATVAIIAVGGDWSNWYGTPAAGIAFPGGFSGHYAPTGFVFSYTLGGNPKYVADDISHEAGHLYGLLHQSDWSGTALSQEYNTGNSAWAPIMGVGYGSSRVTWYNGTSRAGPTTYQDDMAIIANTLGYKPDDFGDTIATASTLPTTDGTNVNFSGLIGQNGNQDVWSFTTTGGVVNLQLNVAQYGPNLDAVLELQDSSSNSLAISAPSDSQDAAITEDLPAGTYYLLARSNGDYGDVGQYTITGSLPGAASAPEITVSVGGLQIADGGTLDFGTTSWGAAVTKTVTVANVGNAILTLNALDSNGLPTGFSLVANLGATSLAPGQSTTFTLQYGAATVGSDSGTLSLISNDANEGSFDIQLHGSAFQSAGNINVTVAGQTIQTGGLISFGATFVGRPTERTVTITNIGNAVLTLSSIDASTLPAGFSLVQGFGNTSLNPGETTNCIVRLMANGSGSFSGTLTISSNDPSKPAFVLDLAGNVVQPAPVIKQIIDDGNSGSRLVGTWRTTTGRGYNNDFRTASKGTGSKYATWTFSSLPVGQYQVWATWKVSSTNASNAPYVIFDGGTALRTVRVSQRVGPSSLSADGTVWQSVGTVAIHSGRIVVKLTNAANGQVVADAVRILRVSSAAAPITAPVATEPSPTQLDVSAPPWPFVKLASSGSHEFEPDALPLPRAFRDSPLVQTRSQTIDAAWDSFCATDFRPEEKILAETLDLLGEARGAANPSAAVDAILDDGMTLMALVG
jgi:hypothetical protein